MKSGGHAAHGQLLEPAVAADAVLVVDDGVALRDLAEIAQRAPPCWRAPRAARAPRRSPPRRRRTSRSAGSTNPRRSDPLRTESGGPVSTCRRRSCAGEQLVTARGGATSVAKPSARSSATRRSACVPVGRDDAHALAERPASRAGDRAAARRCRLALAGAGRAERAWCSSARSVVCGDDSMRMRGGASAAGSTRTTSTARSSSRRRAASAADRLVLAQHEVLGGQRQPVLDVARRRRLAQACRLAARLVDHGVRLLDHAHASSAGR